MVEVEPGIWVRPQAVVLMRKESMTGGTRLTLSSGHEVVLGACPGDVAKKLHFITEWKHPPGQRPPE